jgi:hypothetical protein
MEAPEDLNREAEEHKILTKGLKCQICTEDIATIGDLESYGANGGLCTRCAYKQQGELSY